MWFIGSLIGSISLIILNTLSKLYPIQVTNVLILGTISVFTTLCFWYAWQNSPWSFLGVWFLQSAFVSIGAFCANAFIIKQEVTGAELIGIIMIILGAALLKK